MAESLSCLVTGATGYIGGRLVPSLLAAGHRVRCMARDPGKLAGRPWSDAVELAKADVQDAAAVRRALDGIDVAYYLIHSLGSGAAFEERDREAATTFAAAAREAGVRRIVYLGGLVPAGAELSPHLRSRSEVGLVTPVPSGIARPLVESLRNEVVCREHDIAQYVPGPPGGPQPLAEAMRLALRHVRPATASRPSSARADWPAMPTGGPSGPSTAWCSAP